MSRKLTAGQKVTAVSEMYQSGTRQGVTSGVGPSATAANPSELTPTDTTQHGTKPLHNAYGSEGWGFDSLRARSMI
jgi:hypothetical protein